MTNSPWGRLYPRQRTKISQKDFVKAIIIAWKQKFNEDIKKEVAYLICSKYSLETGIGASCWNFNIGNIKKVTNDNHQDGYFQLPGTWEIINGKRVVFPAEHPASYFRNYFSLESAMADYLSFIQRRKAAFNALLTGNPREYARQLKIARYYTAPEEDYAKAVQSYFNVLMKTKYFEDSVLEISQAQPAPMPITTPEPVVTTNPEPIKPPTENPENDFIPVVIELPEDKIDVVPTPVTPPKPTFLDFLMQIIMFLLGVFKKK